jgi:hypothetical protein
MLETPADLDTLLDPEVFGTCAAWRGAAGAEREVWGIFTASYAVLARGDAIGVSGLSPVYTVAAVHFAGDPPRKGDRLTIDGVDYVVADPQPDGSGLIRLILERD